MYIVAEKFLGLVVQKTDYGEALNAMHINKKASESHLLFYFNSLIILIILLQIFLLLNTALLTDL